MHFHKLSFVGFLIFFVLKKQTDLYGLQYNTEPDVRETPSSMGYLIRNISKHTYDHVTAYWVGWSEHLSSVSVEFLNYKSW